MFLKILIAVVVLVIAFVVVAAFQPTEFQITRSTTIAAPPALVFPHINNLHRWGAWSPWVKLDPSAQLSYSGPEEGVGAGYHWAGNAKAGEGRMTITESTANERILMDLEFIKPFKANNVTAFSFRPEGDQTAVTWTMTGRNNLMGKAVGLIINCDKMVGGQFEEGFANLKAVVAAQGKS